MNVETTYRPAGAQAGYVGGEEASVKAAGAARPAPKDAPLTVMEAKGELATGAARRLDAAEEADALGTDRLDSLIKSVIDFPPPPMPEFT